MVFNVVVGAAWQVFGDFRPAVPVDCVVLQNQRVFFLRPAVFLDVWVQMVVPPATVSWVFDLPLTALLADATLQELGDLTPILSLIEMHFFD